jgi:hypothetical protein
MEFRNLDTGRYFDCGEGLVVYFSADSGDTHLVSEFAAHLIQQTAGKTLALDQMVDLIAPDIDPGELPQLRATLEGVLMELVSLDILEVV